MEKIIEKVLVAVNGTEQAQHAAMYSIMLAKELKCQLKAVFVVDSATLKSLTLSKFFVAEESAMYETALKKDGQKYLDYVANLAKSKGVKVELELLNGSVWSEIVRAADNFDADILILGGRNAVRSSIQGSAKYDIISSTYKEILLNAHCNVMLVNESDLERKFKIK